MLAFFLSYARLYDACPIPELARRIFVGLHGNATTPAVEPACPQGLSKALLPTCHLVTLLRAGRAVYSTAGLSALSHSSKDYPLKHSSGHRKPRGTLVSARMDALCSYPTGSLAPPLVVPYPVASHWMTPKCFVKIPFELPRSSLRPWKAH